MAKDLYQVLGVSKSASEKELRTAYRKLARKYHPDVAPNDKPAEARFKEVNAAFEVLSDPDKRKKYDKYGERWEYADQIEEAERQRATFRSTRRGGAPGGFSDGGSGDLGSIFDSLFNRGGRGNARQASRRGQDLEQRVDITLEEAFHGTERVLTMNSEETCVVCGGTGEVASATCHACMGAGVVARDRRIEVKVPAGVRTGSRVRVAGEGQHGIGGGARGDLFLLVSVRDNARFERKGDDLATDVAVPLIDSVLGGEVEVTTLDGRVALRIPELTQNGRQFRLARKGMPVLGKAGARGDLLVRARVQLPDALTPEEREHFEALRNLQAGKTPAGTH